MIVNVSYPLAALHEAATFIWEKNTSITKWPSSPQDIFDVKKHIQEIIRNGAINNAKVIVKEKKLKVNLNDEWLTYTGTGGYYILFDLQDSDDKEITIGATILIDPAISNSIPRYIIEFVDTIGEEV